MKKPAESLLQPFNTISSVGIVQQLYHLHIYSSAKYRLSGVQLCLSFLGGGNQRGINIIKGEVNPFRRLLICKPWVVGNSPLVWAYQILDP